jgi:hypothetical protein
MRKVRTTKYRLYSKERKRGTSMGTTMELTGQLKSHEERERLS